MARKRPVTANDVANRAGVSRSTVSVVLNNARSTIRVSDATRTRIQAIADELGYSPNRTAQALRRRQSGVIGFVPMPVTGTYRPFDLPVQFLLGSYVSRAALDHGFHAVEVPAEIAASPAVEETTRFLMSLDVDGVIFHGADHSGRVQAVLDLGIPVVELMRTIHGAASSTVTVDPRPGIFAAVDHLLHLGHSQLAFVGTSADHPNDTARKDAFVQRMAERGMAVASAYIQEYGSRYAVDYGCASMQALLSMSTPPTAVLAAGDILALGVMHALYKAGSRVPDDISVISYDDAFVDSLYPPLTSIAQPFKEVSARAVSIIAKRIASPASPSTEPEHFVFPSKLVVRASSSTPKEGGISKLLQGPTAQSES